jgi:hypothetical protein
MTSLPVAQQQQQPYTFTPEQNMEEKYSFYKTINTGCNLFKFTLCPTVRRNNSVSEGITL